MNIDRQSQGQGLQSDRKFSFSTRLPLNTEHHRKESEKSNATAPVALACVRKLGWIDAVIPEAQRRKIVLFPGESELAIIVAH